MVHGPPPLDNVAFSCGLIAAGFALLAVSIWLKKRQPEGACGYNAKLEIRGRKIFETSDRWISFTVFIMLVALGSHFLAEYGLHIYDITPVDRFTHGFSGMAGTAFILNFNLSRGRRVYYPAAIGLSWIGFIAWEVYEWVTVMTVSNSGIVTGPWDLAVDLWIDTLAALAICFFYDEFHKEKRPKKEEVEEEVEKKEKKDEKRKKAP